MTDNAAKVRQPVTAAVVVAVLACSSVQVRAAVAGGRAAAMPSVGGAKASFAEPPTASYLTTANGVGASQTTPGGLAVPVVHNAPAYPHDGGAALHAQGYAYGPIRSAPAGAAAAFPANYIAPGAPVPMSAPSLGSFVQLRQGKTFPASGIGNHNHFLNTIYTHPHVVWHSHAPWHQHALYPNPQATTWYRPPCRPFPARPITPFIILFTTTKLSSLTHHIFQQQTMTRWFPRFRRRLHFASGSRPSAQVQQALLHIQFPAIGHYNVLAHPALPYTHDPNHLVTVYPPVYHGSTAKMPFVPEGTASPVQVVEQHIVHHHAVPALPSVHHSLLSGDSAHYLPVPPLAEPGKSTRFLQVHQAKHFKDLPPSAEWIRPPSPKYRFGAGVPLTPVNGASEHIVHALLPGVAQEGGPAMMYGSNSPATYQDPHPPPGQPQHWSHQSSLANPMYQQTNVMGSEAAKAPDVPKYSAVKR